MTKSTIAANCTSGELGKAIAARIPRVRFIDPAGRSSFSNLRPT